MGLTGVWKAAPTLCDSLPPKHWREQLSWQAHGFAQVGLRCSNASKELLVRGCEGVLRAAELRVPLKVKSSAGASWGHLADPVEHAL